MSGIYLSIPKLIILLIGSLIQHQDLVRSLSGETGVINYKGLMNMGDEGSFTPEPFSDTLKLLSIFQII